MNEGFEDDRPSIPPPGALVGGKYRLDRLLGHGGMGVVYSATHTLLDVPVAVKVLTATGSNTIRRFMNEARAAARIQSEHVTRVSDFGTTDSGQPFMVMELLEGEDLDDMLKRRKVLPIEEAVDYVVQALAGMSEAHALGIVPRDLKPKNLFLTWRAGRPRVKVLDFGISKDLGEDSSISTAGNVLGSPVYMAPEQLRGGKVDARTDLWAAGVLLYQLTTGARPFGEGERSVFASVLEDEPPPLRSVRPDVPEAFEAVVMKCLHKKPDERWSTAAELVDALAPFLSEDGKATLAALRASVPSLRPLPTLEEAEASSRPPAPAAPSTPPRRALLVIAIVAGVLACGAIALAWAIAR